MDLRTIHTQAMDLAEKAMIARARGNKEVARKHLEDALRKEARAASLAVESGAPEPTRSILLKSAAHLAIDCGDLRRAEQFIGAALAGDPPEELAHELRGLFEEVGFHRHLDLRGVELQSNDFQMVLVGHAIAPGMAAYDELSERIETMQSLIYRTSESDNGSPYRERGDPKRAIEAALQLFVSVPRAASFAVSLRVAGDKGQAEFEFAESAQVLDRLLDRLKMFDLNDLDALHHAIPKERYFDNFIKLASELAPDGDKVRMVGLTTRRGSIEKRIQMKRPAKADKKGIVFVSSNESKRFQGRVFLVNTKDEDNLIIKLEAENGVELRLKADGKLLRKAAMYAVKRTRVSVTGVQVSRTTLQVEEFKANRGRRPAKRAAGKRPSN